MWACVLDTGDLGVDIVHFVFKMEVRNLAVATSDEMVTWFKPRSPSHLKLPLRSNVGGCLEA